MEISASASRVGRRIFCAFEIDLDLCGVPNVDSRRAEEEGGMPSLQNARVMKFHIIS